jgi:hypothetical protein
MKKGYRAVVVGLTAGCLLYVSSGFKYQESGSDPWSVSGAPTVQIPVMEGYEMLVDPLGYIWVNDRGHRGPESIVQAYRRLAIWAVFDSTGRQVTTISLPRNMKLQTIGEDYIVGIWTDVGGEEFVRMYSLDRGG